MIRVNAETDLNSTTSSSSNKRKKLETKTSDFQRTFPNHFDKSVADDSPQFVHVSCALFHHNVDDAGSFRAFVDFDDFDALSGGRLSDAFRSADKSAHAVGATRLLLALF